MVWGQPGIGKSDIADAVAKATGRQYIDVRALLLDPRRPARHPLARPG